MSSLLSVFMLTRNHEKFVAAAIMSVLEQKVNFEYTILVGDDGSTDGTVDIIKSYCKKYPQRIKLFALSENRGIFENVKNLYLHYEGIYLANLDGDDYWIDENKLQMQVDFLEAHPEYNGCFHDMKIDSSSMPVATDDESSRINAKHGYESYSQLHTYTSNVFPYQVVDRLIIPTSSIIYRNGAHLMDLVQSDFRPNYSFDWWLNLAIVKNSKLKYFPHQMGVYRDHIHSTTKTVGFTLKKQTNILILKSLLQDNYYQHFKKWIFKGLSREYNSLANDSTTDQGTRLSANFSYGWYALKMAISTFLENHRNMNTRNSTG
ncbi:MAG: glycosyltransferase [Candidatus Marinimicrobia bacterium]|nr:glycosyltransferase [Candidatus Neomarinimicrobiota bacterium]